jgi:hypothetical protein
MLPSPASLACAVSGCSGGVPFPAAGVRRGPVGRSHRECVRVSRARRPALYRRTQAGGVLGRMASRVRLGTLPSRVGRPIPRIRDTGSTCGSDRYVSTVAGTRLSRRLVEPVAPLGAGLVGFPARSDAYYISYIYRPTHVSSLGPASSGHRPPALESSGGVWTTRMLVFGARRLLAPSLDALVRSPYSG